MSDRGLVVVACGRRKAAAPSPARQLYTGPYARACMRYGEYWARLFNLELVILSAKHGFVAPNTVLEPYDVTFGDDDAIRLGDFRAQAEQLGFDRYVDVVGGSTYVKIVRLIWPHARALIPKVGGIGRQLAWLKDHTPREATA